MNQLEEISIMEAIHETEKDVYMLVKINNNTKIEELRLADSFYIAKDVEEQEIAEESSDVEQEIEELPKPVKSIDYGKISALYKAGWKVSDVASECRTNIKTVVDHLRREGIYKK